MQKPQTSFYTSVYIPLQLISLHKGRFMDYCPLKRCCMSCERALNVTINFASDKNFKVPESLRWLIWVITFADPSGRGAAGPKPQVDTAVGWHTFTLVPVTHTLPNKAGYFCQFSTNVVGNITNV